MLVHLNRSIGVISAHWVISTYFIIPADLIIPADRVVSASVTVNGILSLSLGCYFSFNRILFVDIVRNVWISLFLGLFFLIHQIFDPLLNLSASVTDVLHTNFHFLFALLTEGVLSFTWTWNLSLRLSAVYSVSNVVHRVVSAHPNWTTLWYVILYNYVWIVTRKLTDLRFRVCLALWRPSHECVF